MSLRDSASNYLRAAGDWARGTTRPDYGERRTAYAGPLPVVPNRFRVLELLGQGGMGVVYRVFDAELEREVALKSLRHLASSDVYHLKNEFRSRAGLDHPNLVELYELHADRRGCFFTMELLRGTDLVTHVRGLARERDYGRLRSCAQQLASALCAVHAAGLLHRDVKPSNIMVTASGRAVLLDFGLAAELPKGGLPEPSPRNAAGTAEYMAPEQATGGALSAAADWYAFGVTLYEAAVGVLPYEGSTFETLRAAKNRSAPRSLREIDPSAPADLDGLISALLSHDPEQRPSGGDVVRLLGGLDGTALPPFRSGERVESDVFANRKLELAQLHGALSDVRRGETRVIAIAGASGIGKSELARQFAEQARRSGALVLAARCHPRESVAFNAIDGLIDGLSQVLAQTDTFDLAQISRDRADSLLRLFPTLGRIPAFSEAVGSLGTAGQLYALAFSGLRQILSGIAERVPLVIWIDDAQAADSDSEKLLRDLLQPPGQAKLLLLLTYRIDGAQQDHALFDASDGQGGAPAAWCSQLDLGPLSLEHGRELAHSLLGQVEADTDAIGRLVDQTTGSPFFIRELVHHLKGHGKHGLSMSPELNLTAVLQQRLNQLDGPTRHILEVTAVAGGRIALRVLLQAAALDAEALPHIQALERASLLRAHRDQQGAHAEVYHQLISDQVLAAMTEDRRKLYHRAVGDALLSAEDLNLLRIVEQYEAGGALDRVRCYLVSAAARAQSTFAFDRAVQLYLRALDLGGTELSDQELYRRLGDSYADQGRCLDAARAYQCAADQAERAGLGDETIVTLRLAAAQYLQAGEEAAGLRLLERTLEAHRLPIPTTRASAVRRLLWYRALLFVRGLSFTPRSEGELPSGQLNRLDALWVVSRTWSMVEHTTSMAFGTQYLIEALDAGEPRRMMQALATEAIALSAGPGKRLWPYVDRMHAIVDSLQDGGGDRYMLAGRSACRGIVWYFRGQLSEALAELDFGLSIYRTMPRTAALDLSITHNFRFATLAHLGQLKRLRTELEDTMRDGQLRNDRFLLRATTAGQTSLCFIANDEVALARSFADAAIANATSQFSTVDYWHLISHTLIALYEGRSADAFARMERAFPALKKNHFLRLSFIGDELRYLRARAALAYAWELRAVDGTLPAQAKRALRIAEQEAKSIARHQLAFCRPWSLLIEGGVLLVSGKVAQGKHTLTHAMAAFAAGDMPLYRAVIAHTLSRLSAGVQGALLAEEARTYAEQEEIKNLPALCRVFLPAFA
jgi:hypothetical protein